MTALPAPGQPGRHVIVVDLGYGDAGKGTVVDWLCATRHVHTVVRFNGGAQAAHNVVRPDGRHHTFAQFGAGTFHPGVRTHLARQQVVDPLALAAEADHLASVGVPDALDRLTVDGEALLATPYHRAANRLREIARGPPGTAPAGWGWASPSGTGSPTPTRPPGGRLPGSGAAAPPAHRAPGPAHRRARPAGRPAGGGLPAGVHRLRRPGGDRRPVVPGRGVAGRDLRLRGGAGVLLDEWHGFHPYTTWSTTTFANAETLLAEAGAAGSAYRLGVVRTVTTRHGPGPLVTEDRSLPLTDPHNPTNPWQGRFRFGHFDAVAHRYALDVAGGVDGLALTHLDLAGPGPDRPALRLCRGYEGVDRLRPGPPGDLDRQAALTARLLRARPVYDAPPADWPAAVAGALAAPVVLTSHGPTAADKREHPAPAPAARWADPPTRPRAAAG